MAGFVEGTNRGQITLLAGRYDSGLTLLSFAEEHPDRLEVAKFIGVVVDPWLVLVDIQSLSISP